MTWRDQETGNPDENVGNPRCYPYTALIIDVIGTGNGIVRGSRYSNYNLTYIPKYNIPNIMDEFDQNP